MATLPKEKRVSVCFTYPSGSLVDVYMQLKDCGLDQMAINQLGAYLYEVTENKEQLKYQAQCQKCSKCKNKK